MAVEGTNKNRQRSRDRVYPKLQDRGYNQTNAKPADPLDNMLDDTANNDIF